MFVVEYVYTNVSMLDQKIKCFAFQMLSGAWTAKSIADADAGEMFLLSEVCLLETQCKILVYSLPFKLNIF